MNINKLIYSFYCFFLPFSLISCAQNSGTVVKIKDGDTVVILNNDKTNMITIRVAQIDCPEKNQPYGKKAKMFTSNEIYLKHVNYEIINTDKYGRTIAKIYYDNKKSLAEELLKNGFAWHYRQYSNSYELDNLQIQARNAKLGLWQDENPTPPWEYRKR